MNLNNPFDLNSLNNGDASGDDSTKVMSPEEKEDEKVEEWISRIRSEIDADHTSCTPDTSKYMKTISLLIEEIKKKHSPQVIVDIFHLFSSMCTYSSQYVTKLCKSGILNIIRTHLDKENTRIQEIATILLGDVVKLYASPSKAYTKGDKFDMTVRASVMSHDFISRLVRMIVKPDQSVQLQKACFWCLSQYNNEIQFSEDDCIQVLATINILLNGTADEDLLINICNAITPHFVQQTTVIYLIASCVIPNIIELLAYPSIQVVSCSLRVVGYVVALDRNEKENIDYTEYVVDCGVVKYLRKLLESPDLSIVKSVCWTISNIIAGTPEQIQSIIDNNCIPKILSLLKSDMGKDIKTDANWVFLNAPTCGSDEQIDYFVKEGIIEFLISLLQTENQCQDVEDAIYAIIRAGDRVAGPGKANPYISYISAWTLHEIASNPQNKQQKQAEALLNNLFCQCGICHQFYYVKDLSLKKCDECNCLVCENCDCSVYHLDYQLKHWEENERIESKKRSKRKNRKAAPPKPGEKEITLTEAELDSFKTILASFLEDFDMIKVSQMLQ